LHLVERALILVTAEEQRAGVEVMKSPVRQRRPGRTRRLLALDNPADLKTAGPAVRTCLSKGQIAPRGCYRFDVTLNAEPRILRRCIHIRRVDLLRQD
jgi:hypothetical protein